MRRTADTDQAFWSKPGDRGTAWMDELGPDGAVDDAASVLDDLALGPAPTDRVFHELRDVAPTGLAAGDATIAGVSGDGHPDGGRPPAASTSTFDFAAVTDDLLPTWNLDLS